MIVYENHLGCVDLSEQYFYDLVSGAVSNCFGVAGLSARTQFPKQKAVSLQVDETGLIIDLHLVVYQGVNLNTIAKSIIHKVTYQVETLTELSVNTVNVYIDGMIEENESPL